MFEPLSKDEEKIAEPFFTNLDKPIFVLKNLPQVVCGTLFSRYSRSSKPLRRLLIDDFINRDDVGFKDMVGMYTPGKDLVAIKKAEEFYDRVLVDFGDDSVAELGGAHLACEQVSQLAAKALEDPRIGLSPLEKSTRYLYFDYKPDGEYMYYKGKEIIDSKFGDIYTEICDTLFDTYSELMNPAKEFFEKKFPQEKGVSDRAYNSTMKAKTCDTLRGLLPAATLTNLGIFGNGRAFDYLCTKLFSDPLPENKNIGEEVHTELMKVIPSFVKRTKDQYGQKNIAFLENQKKNMQNKAKELNTPPKQEEYYTKLIWSDNEGIERVIAQSIYPETNLSMKEVFEKVKKMSETEKKKIIDSLLSHRENRRHKPSRGFEASNYCFEVNANFGAFRDIQRHRMLTQQRKLITTHLGYDIPKEIKGTNLAEKFESAMKKAHKTFEKIERINPFLAQYIVPLAYRMKWHMTMNAREVFHMAELRSIAAGHPEYRIIAQDVYTVAKKVHPLLFEHAKYVDMKSYELERLESEKGQDKKMKAIEEKYNKKTL